MSERDDATDELDALIASLNSEGEEKYNPTSNSRDQPASPQQQQQQEEEELSFSPEGGTRQGRDNGQQERKEKQADGTYKLELNPAGLSSNMERAGQLQEPVGSSSPSDHSSRERNLRSDDDNELFARILEEQKVFPLSRIKQIEETREAEKNWFQPQLLKGFRYSSASDPGRQRKLDEDSILTLELTVMYEGILTRIGAFAVADGAGGHQNGEVASRLAISQFAQSILEFFVEHPSRIEKQNLIARLKECVNQTNKRVRMANWEATESENVMVTTLTSLLITGKHAFIANVGDSRTYLLPSGSSRLIQITTDQTLATHLVQQGIVTPDSEKYKQFSSILTSALGQDEFEVDFFQVEIQQGDLFLLACDGLSDMLSDELIAEIIQTHRSDLHKAAQVLIEQANAHGGIDNISLILVEPLFWES